MPLRVPLVDKVHNVRCLLRDHRLVGEAVWDRFSVAKGETRLLDSSFPVL